MENIRWKQRFDNLEKAYSKFLVVIDIVKKNPDDEIYEMALIQSFEFVYELSWKTIKDYLKNSGVYDANLPREVIKSGFHFKIIEDGQLWIDMMSDRNMLSHTYNEIYAKKTVKKIISEYYPALKQVFEYFSSKINE
ncbi:MAG: nucleotidyltransferase substrate binding protein [Candidatus Muiribacteriota bacterium]|jgi:nucleotidyltransferase substrate binding protein (TIGR01987 family)